MQSDFLVPLMENLKAQQVPSHLCNSLLMRDLVLNSRMVRWCEQDNQIALATARGAVGRWKAATKASTPR